MLNNSYDYERILVFILLSEIMFINITYYAVNRGRSYCVLNPQALYSHKH